MSSTFKEYSGIEQAAVGSNQGYESEAHVVVSDEPVQVQVRYADVNTSLEWTSGTGTEDEKYSLSAEKYKIGENPGPLLLLGSRRTLIHRPRNGAGVAYAALLPYSDQLNSLQVAARSGQLLLDNSSSWIDWIREFDADILNVEVASFGGFRPAIYVKSSCRPIPRSTFRARSKAEGSSVCDLLMPARCTRPGS